jgi:dihydroorotate dehydrogenase
MKTKYETDFLNTRKIAEDNLLNQINLENSPDDQSLKNALLAKAKSEMQKVQQLVIANDKNEELNTKYNKELKKDVTLKNNLEINKKIPSKKLLDRIQSNQDYLDDLTIKIDSVTTNIGASEIDVKAAISELRKVDPKAAASLENSLNLKKKNKETREINKKRI